MLAGGLPPAGGVTTPGAFPPRGVAGTPVGESRRWARPAAAFRRGSGNSARQLSARRRHRRTRKCSRRAGVTLGGFPPNAGATGAGVRVSSFPPDAGAAGAPVGDLPPAAGATGAPAGGLPPTEGAGGVPAGGFTPGPAGAPIGGNGLTWPTTGPVTRTGTGGGGCTGVTLRGSGGGAGGGGRKGGRPAGAIPLRL